MQRCLIARRVWRAGKPRYRRDLRKAVADADNFGPVLRCVEARMQKRQTGVAVSVEGWRARRAWRAR